MQFIKRFTLVFMCGILTVVAYVIYRHAFTHHHNSRRYTGRSARTTESSRSISAFSRPSIFDDGSNPRSFISEDTLDVFADDLHHDPKNRSQYETRQDWRKCRMETCFDFGKCKNGFKIYIYPRQVPVSEPYAKILSVIEKSRYITANPMEACIFVPSIDTLDQDVLSVKDYVPHVGRHLKKLPYWNGGRNHLLFNQYSGTFPDYSEELNFIQQAMLVKSSMSIDWIRPGFDVSMPLFPKDHPQSGGEMGYLHTASNSIPSVRYYLLGFKGKRYLNGIGSDARNSLYHINNGKDVVLLTTCKHGKNWEKLMNQKKDERCLVDNEQYEKYDYKKLLFNSTFCLVPRGRRLGSFRFLESVQATCIPVLLSNGYELPFSDVIDWNKVVVWGDERLMLQLPAIVRSISQSKILAMRQQAQLVWETYLSSVDKIINTVIEVVKNRVHQHYMRPSYHWNTVPGAHVVLPEWSDIPANYPFYYGPTGEQPSNKFTAVVYATSAVTASAPLFRVLRTVAKSHYCHKIIVLWHCNVAPPPSSKWPSDLGVPVRVKTRDIKSINSRFYPYKEIETDAVFNLDEDVLLTTDEIDFAFSVWQEFPERIVGYASRVHYWDDITNRWRYSSKWTNEYSMVLTSAALYHRYYNYLYTHFTNPLLVSKVEECGTCEDILMNFVVAHATRLSPIKLTQRKQHKESSPNAQALANMAATGGVDGSAPSTKPGASVDFQKFQQRQECMEVFVEAFGYMPLLHSVVRLDTMLFKDPVSNMRKKYRQIETVNS